MMEAVRDIFKCAWYLTWRTALFLGAIVGFMFLVALVAEVL